MKKLDWVLTALFILTWGANFTVTKIGINNMPPMLLASIRYALVAFPAMFFVKRPAIDWYYTVGYAMTMGISLITCLFYAIYIGMPAGLSSVVMQSSSFISILLAMLVFKEKLSFHQVAGLIIAVSGLALIGLSTGAASGTPIPLAALILTVMAAFFWSVSTVIVKAASKKATRKGVKVDMLGLVVWSALIPPIPLLLVAATMDTPKVLLDAFLKINPAAILSILFLAWCSTLFGTSAWNHLLSKYDTKRMAPLTLLVPVFGLLIARVALIERLSPLQWAGSLVIILGLIVFNLGFSPIKALRIRYMVANKK